MVFIPKKIFIATLAIVICALFIVTLPASAEPQNNQKTDSGKSVRFNQGIHRTIRDVCGGTVDGQDESVGIAIKIGCKGKGNPIADATFAVIRILSNLVGLVIVGSIVVGGIQYSGSRGDPQATALAVGRIRSSLFALILFLFGYAMLNYLIPKGFLG